MTKKELENTRKEKTKEEMTGDELRRKVDREFYFFYLDMMRTSRENIFSHAQEIETKRKIKQIFCESPEGTKIEVPVLGKLLCVDNLLESVYCRHKNHTNQNSSLEEIQREVDRFFGELQTEKKKMF